MATWIFEPGHTEAEFRARHMMVTWVRGLFKDVQGRLELDWERCLDATFEGDIEATKIWTGDHKTPGRAAAAPRNAAINVSPDVPSSLRIRFATSSAHGSDATALDFTVLRLLPAAWPGVAKWPRHRATTPRAAIVFCAGLRQPREGRSTR